MKLKNEGQATIEFIFSFGLLLFFFLFFVTVGINVGIGYVAHYAVFKASRFYLTYDNGENRVNVLNAAANNIDAIPNQLVKLGIKEKVSINSPLDTEIYEFVGVKLLYTPTMTKIGPFSFEEDFKFLSESFLGKEPSRAECRCRTQIALGGGCEQQFEGTEVTVDDNGC